MTRHVLVAYGSKHGSTAEIASWIGDRLRADGVAADVSPAAAVDSVTGYDAVVVGGALYMRRWHKDARRFARRHRAALQRRPVWLFSSGPLEEVAPGTDIAQTKRVAKIAERIDARGHTTFAGRIRGEDGRLARSMAAKMDRTDFRDRGEIDAWADMIAAAVTRGSSLTPATRDEARNEAPDEVRAPTGGP